MILSTIYFRIDSILISLIKDQSEVGIYAIALRVLEAFQVVPLYFMNSVLPVLTRAMKESVEKAKTIISYSFDFLTALSVPLLVGAYILAYPIIFIVSNPGFLSRIGDGFYGSDIALKYLMFALVFQFIGTLFSFVLLSLNKQSKILYINLGCVIFKIVMDLIFIPKFGFRGAAITSIVAEFLVMAVGAIVAFKYFKYSFNFLTTAKIIFSALAMGFVVKLLHPISYDLLQNFGIIPLIIIGAVVYGALLILTKAVDRNMLRMLKKTPPVNSPELN